MNADATTVGTNKQQRLTETQALELWASAEVCGALGWSRLQLKLAIDAGTFPEPIGVVAAGRIKVWDASAVRAWYVETQPQERTREWRRDQAVRLYRRGLTIAAICRQLKAKDDSVRRWLRAAGEQTPKERRDASAA